MIKGLGELYSREATDEAERRTNKNFFVGIIALHNFSFIGRMDGIDLYIFHL